MERYLLLTLLAIFLHPYSSLPAQNLVPNGDFSQRSQCPNDVAQFQGYVSNWDNGNQATPEYAACSYTGNSFIRTIPDNGGAAGLWGGSGHGFCPGSAYVETLRGQLNTAMVTGQNYDVAFKVMIDGTGTSTNGPNNCMDFGIYFFRSGNAPSTSGTCCLPVSPHFSIPATTISQGNYQTFSITFNADQAYDRFLIGPFCNDNSGLGPCANYLNSRMYFNLDSVDIRVQAGPLSVFNFDLRVNHFGDYNQLSWDRPGIGRELSEFIVEKSRDGEAFSEIGREDARGAEQKRRFFDDFKPWKGRSYYRIAAIDENGDQIWSKTVSVFAGDGVGESGGALPYTYDPGSGSLRFFVTTDDVQGGRILLSDLNGKLLHQSTTELFAGTNELSLDLNGVANGVYLLKVLSTDGQLALHNKIVKY